jgi:hypothetical protein
MINKYMIVKTLYNFNCINKIIKSKTKIVLTKIKQ